MEVIIVKTSLSRETGELLSQEVIGSEEINEDEYYRPLVEMFFSRIFPEKVSQGGKNNE